MFNHVSETEGWISGMEICCLILCFKYLQKLWAPRWLLPSLQTHVDAHVNFEPLVHHNCESLLTWVTFLLFSQNIVFKISGLKYLLIFFSFVLEVSPESLCEEGSKLLHLYTMRNFISYFRQNGSLPKTFGGFRKKSSQILIIKTKSFASKSLPEDFHEHFHQVRGGIMKFELLSDYWFLWPNNNRSKYRIFRSFTLPSARWFSTAAERK